VRPARPAANLDNLVRHLMDPVDRDSFMRVHKDRRFEPHESGGWATLPFMSDAPTPFTTVPGDKETPFRFAVADLRFSDGTVIPVPESGVLLFVGPNNAGKSAALRDLVARLTTPAHNRAVTPVVAAVGLTRQGTAEDLQKWLESNAFRVERPQTPTEKALFYQRPNANQQWDALSLEWQNSPESFPNAAPFFVFYASAEQRLGLVGGAGVYDPMVDAPSNPLQVLFANPELERSVSMTCYEAFGTGLTLARVWGSSLQLHLGETSEKPSIPPSSSYIQALQAMPLLQEQGDGMRSFMGLMLAIVTAQFPIIVVDEPEAFLHPPQARLLGRKLATDTPENTQVFVATHDTEILQGLLAPRDANVTVVRLVREGAVNRTSVLRPEELREIWKDPLLRYSNVLDGLFHRGVIVSESDADSRYYSAILDAKRERDSESPHDLLFTQSGGKDRLPVVIGALRALAIPVAAVADFDVLRDEQLLKRIVEGLGGTWSLFKTDWEVLSAAAGQLGSAPLLSSVKSEVKACLDREPGPNLSRDAAETIRSITKLNDSWTRLKSGGISAIPQGDASARTKALLDALAEIGLFVVEVGELERWEPDLAGHGPSWVGAAIQAGRHEQPGSATEKFVARLSAFFDRA
jgi:hypothetical protein